MRRAAKVDANQTEILKFEKFGIWACNQCGKQKPATVHQKRKTYCSMECMAKGYAKRLVGEGNPNHKKAGYQICTQCKNTFHSYQKNRLFCSRACHNDSRKICKDSKCLQCGIDFIKRNSSSKFCSQDCFKKSRPRKKYVPTPRKVHLTNCLECGLEFRYSPSTERLFCCYECFVANGGPLRAGESAVKAMKKYGAKKDGNHKEIFGILTKLVPVHDLSASGCGIPDGVAWIKGGWQFFDVKNPKTGYGKRGLNERQKRWANDWRGGKVYLIYTDEDAINFANGNLNEIKKFPDD